MKKTLILLLCFNGGLLPIIFAQDHTIQNNTTSVTILPTSISTKHISTPAGGSDKSIAIGKDALQSQTIARENNIAIGLNALYSNALGTSNDTQATNNIALGNYSLTNHRTGQLNLGLGHYTQYQNQTGVDNISIGHAALYSNLGGNANIGIGYAALHANKNSWNLGIGTRALSANINNPRNLAIGYEAMKDLYQILVTQEFTDSSTNNIAIGYQSMTKAVQGFENTVVGSYSMANAVSGSGNTALGTYALRGGTNSSFSSNVALGTYSQWSLVSGSGNVAVGSQSLFTNASGEYNVAIGNLAGYPETGSNKLYIENTSSATPLIGGDFAADKVGINRSVAAISSTNFTFQVGGDASKNSPGSWSGHSDKRLKKNIQGLNSAEMLNKLLQLKGVTYEWNDTFTQTQRPTGIQMGFIAQNIESVFPDKIKKDANGFLMTAYSDYDPIFVEAIRELHQMITELKTENKLLKSNLEALRNDILHSHNSKLISDEK
jgi:hypothetical protein